MGIVLVKPDLETMTNNIEIKDIIIMRRGPNGEYTPIPKAELTEEFIEKNFEGNRSSQNYINHASDVKLFNKKQVEGLFGLYNFEPINPDNVIFEYAALNNTNAIYVHPFDAMIIVPSEQVRVRISYQICRLFNKCGTSSFYTHIKIKT